jgi:hypothetical protein
MSTVTALPIGNTDQVLNQAADYLTRYGWTPTGLYDAHNGCTEKAPCRVTGDVKCWPRLTGRYPASIIGAIRAAVFGAPRWYLDTATDNDRHAYTAAVEWLNTYLLAIGHSRLHATVFDWQTAPGRTFSDVCGALHQAADAHRRRSQRRAA